MSLSIESPLLDLTFKKNTFAVVWIGEKKKVIGGKQVVRLAAAYAVIKIMVMWMTKKILIIHWKLELSELTGYRDEVSPCLHEDMKDSI